MVRYGLLATCALAAPAAAQTTTPATDIVVVGKTLDTSSQTSTTVDSEAIRNLPATTIADLVKLSPGVSVMQGNGPRDAGVSIRGSNARNGFGARNIVVSEDGFPVTQPDGLARFDLTDPHAYAAIDVVRGPSSARYGNYALGGAVDFRTRQGADVDGVDLGFDAGSDRYFNLYGVVGQKVGDLDYAVFGSFVGGDGATGHTRYRTGTINALATWTISDHDRLTAKLIYNQGEFRLSTRLSYNQYLASPYQQGCERTVGAAPGCGTISVLVNGVNGPRVAQTATEGDLARDDQRIIGGLRYEHDLSPGTVWRTQVTLDGRNPFQPTSATPFRGTLNSVAVASEIAAKHWGIGAFYSVLDNRSFSFNKTPAGRRGYGAPTQTVLGTVANAGIRAHGDLALTKDLDLLLAAAAERSVIDMRQIAYSYPTTGGTVTSFIPALRRFWNVAPEASLRWQASSGLRLHARVGTGYGIPQGGQLFVTSAGVAGNNTALKPQRNVGVDLGAEYGKGPLRAELTLWQEWFTNELVTQSAGVNLLSFTTNVPKSLHRGVELGAGWMPTTGLRGQVSVGYTDQHYTDYRERLTSGAIATVFDRAGNDIPGVMPVFANARLGYEHGGGIGALVELTHRGRYAIDNANLLKLPAYTLANINLHYDPPGQRYGFYASVQNLFDETYVGSATVIANNLTGTDLRTVTGSIYAGQPRSVFVGMRGHF